MILMIVPVMPISVIAIVIAVGVLDLDCYLRGGELYGRSHQCNADKQDSEEVTHVC